MIVIEMIWTTSRKKWIFESTENARFFSKIVKENGEKYSVYIPFMFFSLS